MFIIDGDIIAKIIGLFTVVLVVVMLIGTIKYELSDDEDMDVRI